MRFLSLLSLTAVAAGLCACQQRFPERELTAKIQGRDAAERYAVNVKHLGERAQQLRRAAAKAATMRIRMVSLYLKKDECLPLTREEERAVREILAELEETPVHDKKLWPDTEYDIYFGPQPAAAIYDSAPEFAAADGRVLDSFREFDAVMGDAAQAEAYRCARYCPAYMLPSAALQRWNAQPFFSRAQKLSHEPFCAKGLMLSDARAPAAVFQKLR